VDEAERSPTLIENYRQLAWYQSLSPYVDPTFTGRRPTDGPSRHPRVRMTVEQQVVPAVDYVAQLEKLGQLRDAGVLTDEEFQAKKAEILRRI
jgi:hypothetical protein